MNTYTIDAISSYKLQFEKDMLQVEATYRKGAMTLSQYLTTQLDLFNQFATDVANAVLQD